MCVCVCVCMYVYMYVYVYMYISRFAYNVDYFITIKKEDIV